MREREHYKVIFLEVIMAVTNVSEIKPQQSLRNHVNRYLTKNSLTRLENAVKGFVCDVVSQMDWVNEIANATEQEAEAMSVAPVECSRFPSSVVMSCRESLKISFWPLNGYDSRSKIFVTLKTAQIRKSFAVYGSGAMRRDEPRKKYPQLETLISGSYVPDEAGIECEIEWREVDEVPQMKLLLCTAFAGDSTKWISSPLCRSCKQLIDKLNKTITHYAEAQK